MADRTNANVSYNRLLTEIQKGWGTAFLNQDYQSSAAYKPQFVSNNYREGRKVLASIEDELQDCKEFAISVAFVNTAGIAPLLMMLQELARRGVPGKILTTDYLNYSQPEAMDKLAELPNIELRIYRCNEGREGFHTKGYLFRKETLDGAMDVLIIGSSNLTDSALTKNREWNVRLVSTQDGEMIQSIHQEFNQLWNATETLPYADYIDAYRARYEIIRHQRKLIQAEPIPELEAYRLQPNDMQIRFLQELHGLREQGERRALLISATGTGKTYASAFALREELKPDRALFLVHREQIALQAMKSFRKVYGSSKSMGLLSGNAKDFDADILFATMQTMAKEDVMARLGQEAFDVIVIDEVHRAGATSYQRIMDFFQPDFWLGMTASPERTDGFDIYQLFDHNIACEIRLQEALEQDFLCPFHYFGITDITIAGERITEERALRDFACLVSEERINHILSQAEYFGHSGSRVKGLVFCSRNQEAEELSRLFNQRGYHTVALSGADSQEKRLDCTDRLLADTGEDLLDYIFTVDIFNEGVDLPAVNQILLLRPTQSPVIFVQQLGRGLRKWTDKEYVVILDFIGSYANNYMIPLALSGDRSYSKDSMRRYVGSGGRILPGASTIHFDEIARKEIYASIDSAKTSDLKLLRDSYTNLKHKLGRIPVLTDFRDHGEIDIRKFFDKCGSYHRFLEKYEPSYTLVLTPAENQIIDFLSSKVSAGKRPYDLEILLALMDGGGAMAAASVLDKIPAQIRASVLANLTNRFPKNSDQKKSAACVLVDDTGTALAPAFQAMLKEHPAFRSMVLELLHYGLREHQIQYAKPYRDTDLCLYQRYSYEDVCLLLGWPQNQNALNIGGYFFDRITKTMAVFINYEKADDAIPYEDRFLSPAELIALSKHPRRVNSSDADHIYKRTEADRDNRIYLFVRKNKDDKEAKEFYFLGEVHATGEPKPIRMGETGDDAFEIMYRLETSVREDLYRYLTE